MKKYGYGPNGALIYCMEQVVTDFEWFDTEIGEHEYDYLLIDFPGQIELFSHLDVLPKIIAMLQEKGYHMCAVFLLDSQFMVDPAKFLSGGLVALSAMTMLEIPHVNLLSKCDLLSQEQKEMIDLFIDMDTMALGSSIKKGTKLDKLTKKIEKHYRARAKKGSLSETDRSHFVHALKVAIACLEDDSRQFEEALKACKKNVEEQIRLFQKVKLNNIYE